MKKKVVAAIMSVALVAAVGIGGTLAYLSSQSNTVENVFTVGKGFIDDGEHTGLFIDEVEYEEKNDKNVMTGTRTEEGNTYVNLYPGDEFIKDPTVHMVGGSVESYVFVKVTGVDALEDTTAIPGTQTFDITNWNTHAWKKVADSNGNTENPGTEGDGIYLYQGRMSHNNIVDVTDYKEGVDVLLDEALFETLKVNNVNEMPDAGNTLAAKIDVSACAVQAAQNTTWEDAFNDALARFTE